MDGAVLSVFNKWILGSDLIVYNISHDDANLNHGNNSRFGQNKRY